MSQHEYKEAYCIIKFKCNNCGATEYIWNSRDGEIPCYVDCECECEKRLANNYQDCLCIPGLKPMGIRWFVDQTFEEYKQDCLADLIDTNQEFFDFDLESLTIWLKNFRQGRATLYDPRINND